HAAMRFDRFEFAGTPPSKIVANSPYKFNCYYVNAGTETAVDIKMLTRIYIGRADDKQAQLQLGSRFEEDWESGNAIELKTTFVPSSPAFSTIPRTFADNEIENLTSGGTIY